MSHTGHIYYNIFVLPSGTVLRAATSDIEDLKQLLDERTINLIKKLSKLL